MKYTITQYLRVEASSPQQAAIEARKLQLLPDVKALTFYVTDSNGLDTTVKLNPVSAK